jgi:luciferase family oxidoreductase group 1
MSNITLGLLDFGYRLDLNSMARIEDVIDYAVLADQLGFSRFWVSEHHNPLPKQAWNSPEMLLPIIAGMTTDIRVGIAGILLPVHMPYRIALNFKLLSNLYPGRIDLGLAKGFPLIEKVGLMLNAEFKKDKVATLFDKHLSELMTLFLNEKEEFQRDNIVVPPYGGQIPEPWYLGRSYGYTEPAIKYKLNYCRSLFHSGANIDPEVDKIRCFKEQFEKVNGYLPKVSVAIAGYLSDTTRKAEEGLRIIAERHPENQTGFHCVAASPEEFHDKICSFQQLYEVDEFIFLDIAEECSERHQSLHWLSEKFNLKPFRSEKNEQQFQTI